jgi:hypothetical protein
MEGKIKVVRFCEVISIDDPYDAGRIKVRLNPEDKVLENENLPYAIPLLPKMFYVMPKVGEGVLVILSQTNDGTSQRYYIGPIISQWDFLFNNPLFFGSDSIFGKSAPESLIRGVQTVAEMKGTLPKSDDIAIMGRKNCDIIIKDDDIRIRAGVRVVDENNKYKSTFNEKDPGYLKLKYHTDGIAGDVHSTATIVADKINLISNKSSKRRPNNGADNISSYQLYDRDELVTDKELETILNEGYRLPYGEELVAFLKKFIKIFSEHTHPYIMLPPTSNYILDLQNAAKEPLDNEKMLSDAIRIN